MKSTSILMLYFLCVLFAGCATVRDSSPGVSKRELAALVHSYYWQPYFVVPTFTDGELAALMDRSGDPSLDGEYAEAQMSAVAVALVTAGDDRFANILKQRSPEVQRAVILHVRYLWTHNHLSYPLTMALAKTMEIMKHPNKTVH